MSFFRIAQPAAIGTRAGACARLSGLSGCPACRSVYMCGPAAAGGMPAGTLIPNTADMSFTVEGNGRSVRSNTTTTRVDETLDVVVVAEQADLVTTDSPMSEATLSFLLTNTGNGDEDCEIRLQSNINVGGFDRASTTLYMEQNSVSGLQVWRWR